MQPLPHVYTTQLRARADAYGTLSAAGRPPLVTASPAEFGGPGDAWSPEHLLLGAVETCFLFTLRAVARASKVDVLGVEVDARGTVDRQEGVTRFTEIVLRPTVRVAEGTDADRVLRVIEKTERNCLVSASLSTPIRLEPSVEVVRNAA